MRGHGRGAGVGRTLGVGAILGVGVGVGLGAAAQYLPPVLVKFGIPSYPPQTIIWLSLPAQTAV